MSEEVKNIFEVKLDQFSGPLNKLLELIEEKKLDITQISLATVTVDFLNYVKTLGESADPLVLADFVSVAAKLLLIKSKTLIPSFELTEEEEGEIKDLEARLKLYQEFKALAPNILERWSEHPLMNGREYFQGLAVSSVFYPPPTLSLKDMARAVENILAVTAVLQPETRVVKQTVILLEEKIKEIVARVETAVGETFQKMTSDRSRTEIVVMFLAILHLLKERVIRVEQGDHFSDILIEKSEKKSN